MIVPHTVEGPSAEPPLVLLHSLGQDRRMWQPQADALAATHRVVRLDTRGHGEAPSPPGPYTVADLGRDVLDTADELGLDRFHVCGISMGGLTALWLAVHHPGRLLSLTAANTAARVGSAEGWKTRIDAVRTHGLAGIRDDVMTRFFVPGFPEANAAWWTTAQEAFGVADDEGYVACCQALAEADLRDVVASIGVPTLVIGGRHDVSTPPEQAAWLAEHVGGSKLVVLEDAAHLSNLDQPGLFTAALIDHLTSAEGSVNLGEPPA